VQFEQRERGVDEGAGQLKVGNAHADAQRSPANDVERLTEH